MDEAARGKGKRGPAAADEATVRRRGDVSSADEASRTTVWRTATDEAAATRGRVGRRFRRIHKTTAVVIVTRPQRGRGAEPETAAANESQDCCRMRRFCGPGLARRRAGSEDLPS